MEGLGSETTSCPIRWPSWCSKERASWFVSRRVGRWCEKSQNVGDTIGVSGLGANEPVDGHNCVLYKAGHEGVLGTISQW